MTIKIIIPFNNDISRKIIEILKKDGYLPSGTKIITEDEYGNVINKKWID